jgi:hypothetical protein
MIELRGGMNGLEINKGRREGVARGDRWCRCCGRGVEDEKHFMLKCEVYSTDRKEMMLEMNDVCEIGINMIERAGGSDDELMDMLIGRGMEENYEEGMSIVQSYVRRSMRRSMRGDWVICSKQKHSGNHQRTQSPNKTWQWHSPSRRCATNMPMVAEHSVSETLVYTHPRICSGVSYKSI